MAARLRSLLRNAADAGAGLAGAHRWSPPRGALLVLTYHRVLPRTFPELDIVEPGMYVHDDTFAAQLGWLRNEFELVSLADWIQRRERGRPLPERACAVTFDDGWRDNYTYAFPVLAELEVPATIFVVSDAIGTNAQFWPERLARLLRRRGDAIAWRTPRSPAAEWLDGLVARAGPRGAGPLNEWVTKVIAEAKRFPDATIEARLTDIEAEEGPGTAGEPDLLDWRQIGEMVSSGLVSIGSHTCRHTRLLPDLPEAVLRREIVESADVIARHTGRPPELFCYPNGDVGDAAEALVRRHYRGACTTERGWNASNQDPHRLRRITVHEGRGRGRWAFLGTLAGWRR